MRHYPTLAPDPLRIFIGYDPREPVAYHVLCHSIMRHTTIPYSITPLIQNRLRGTGVYWREKNPLESTEFSFTRFLVPYLCGYKGFGLFMDCDMLLRADLGDMLKAPTAHPYASVHVCQHDYIPRAENKMDGKIQTTYPRKNWSSLMLFNNPACGDLSPEYVNTATGLDLHRLVWAQETAGIQYRGVGSLPLEWNWLVDEYEHNPNAKNLHFTLGGPWFPNKAECDYASEWTEERRLAGI